MASISKFGRRRYWYASYRDASGKQHHKSTKMEHSPSGANPKERARKASENRRLAQEVANRLEEAERGHPGEAHLRKVFVDLSEKLNPRRLEFVQTDKFLKNWLDRVSAEKTPGTHARYQGTVNAFLASLGTRATLPLSDITAADIETFVRVRIEDGRSASTVATDAKTLHTPFAQAARQGLILTNPVAQATLPKAEKEIRVPFTAEQIRTLLREAEGTEWVTMILLGAYAGLRLLDAAKLPWRSVDLETRVLRFRPAKTARSKRDLVVPLHPALAEHLTSLPSSDDPDAPLCPGLSKYKTGGQSGLSQQFTRLMQTAGIQQETVAASGKKGRRFNRRTFHSLRHTYVSSLENAGVAPDLRMKLAGHTDTRSHGRYTHTEIETLRKAICNLPRINSLD